MTKQLGPHLIRKLHQQLYKLAAKFENERCKKLRYASMILTKV